MSTDNGGMATFRVRALPMVKEEQTELWRPVKGHNVDSLSIVTLEMRDGHHDIVAHRIADSKEILRSTITHDILYYEPTQSFHHWITAGGTQRNGLTFSNCAAAARFYNQINSIVEEFTKPLLDDINTECTEKDTVAAPADKPVIDVEKKQVPPKRPEKPLSLSTETPPETPPPRLPNRTITPPVNNLPSRSNVAYGNKLPQGNNDDTEAQPSIPLLPPRPASNQSQSHSPLHTIHRTTLTTHSTVSAHKPRQVFVVSSMKQGSAMARQPNGGHQASIQRNRTPSHQAGASSLALRQEQYSDYREYELTPLTKPTCMTATNRAVPNRGGSTSSTVSSLSTTDSITTDSRDIPLPIKGKRPRNPSCVKKKDLEASQVKLLCEVCDERFYESENVKGACRRRRGNSDKVVDACTCTPALNCCLRKCTADSDGRYSPARQSNGMARGKKCRRRALFILLGFVCPCIWCYKLCQHCNRRGKKGHCWGYKHIPVRTKESPS